MKYIAFIVILISFSAGRAESFMPVMHGGAREIGLRGHWDPNGAMGTEFDISGGYGFFPADNFLVGASAGYAMYQDSVSGMSAYTRLWTLGGFMEYHFDIGTLTFPYAGVEAGFASGKLSGAGSLGAFFYGPRVGMKYFISEKLAVDLALKYIMAADDIFLNRGEMEDSDLFVTFGMRAVF